MSNLIINVSDDSFDSDVLRGEGFFLVEFWAEWAGPCKMMAPILDEIASERQRQLTVVKLNIDQNGQTAPRYGVRGVPTLLLFRNGIVVATKVGAASKSQLLNFIDSNI